VNNSLIGQVEPSDDSPLQLGFLSRLFHFRVLKTVTASFLALVVAYLLGMSYPMFPALAACFCIRQTFMASLRSFFVEFKITFHALVLSLTAGGVIELTRLYGVSHELLDFLIIALAMGGVIVIIQFFEWYNAVFVGLLTVLYVLILGPGESYDRVFLARGVSRFGSIVVGSFLALVVDYLFSGYEYKNLFHRRTKQAISTMERMLSMFVEAIVLRSQEMADEILDQAVDSLNLLDYIDDKLEDLRAEMQFRGKDIHGFDMDQLENLEALIRDLRLICFQLEAAGINYVRLMERVETTDEADPLPETDYARFSEKGREMAESLKYLQRALDHDDPSPLGEIPREDDLEVDYSHLFEDMKLSDVRFVATDTMSAIHRIEFHLGRVADRLECYFKLRNGTGED
jgi:hypothetical protein